MEDREGGGGAAEAMGRWWINILWQQNDPVWSRAPGSGLVKSFWTHSGTEQVDSLGPSQTPNSLFCVL